MNRAPRQRLFGRVRAYLIAVLVVVLATAACTSAQVAAPVTDEIPTVESLEPTAAPIDTEVPAPEDLPIIIGVAMAETGVMAQFDRPAMLGMQWQVDEINERGGVLGRDLALEVRDTESRLSITEQVAEELLDSGVAALFVTCDAVMARPAIDQANIRGVLSISPCGGDLEWNDLSLGLLSFSFGNSPVAEGVVMAELAIARGTLTAVTVVDETDPGSIDRCRGFTDSYTTTGGVVLANYPLRFDLLDRFELRLDGQPVPQSSILVLCSHLPGGLTAAPATVDLLRSRGVSTPLLAGSSLDAPGWLRSVLDLGELTVVTPTSVGGDDPVFAVNAMVTDLADGTGLNVRGWSVFGADAVAAFALAMAEVGEFQGLLLAQALERFDGVELISGPVTFSQASHMDPNRLLRVMETSDGVPRFTEARAAQ